jgi:hypothetical protein
MHVRDENLARYVLGRLSPTRSSAIETHVQKCRRCSDRLKRAVEGITPVEERRRDVRSLTDVRAFKGAFPAGSSPASDIRVLDVSKGGLKLRSPERLEPGEIVQIHLKHTIALGEVRYCRRATDGFDVGVQFHNVFSTLDEDPLS